MYEVYTDHGSIQMENEKDAISALWMFGRYEDIEIDENIVKKMLDLDGRYTKGILEIVKTIG